MLFPFFPGGVRLPRRLDLPDADELTTEQIVDVMDTQAAATRIAAARALAARKDERALPALLEGVPSRHFRYSALEGLRMLGDERAREPAAKAMRGAFSSIFERTQAAGVLAALGDPRGVEFLMERLRRRKRDDDRGLAIEVVAEAGVQEAVPELERMAEDKADIFRGASLKALAALRPGEWEDRLCGIARDDADDPDVRADVVEALAKMPGERPRQAIEAASRCGEGELAELAGELLSERR